MDENNFLLYTAMADACGCAVEFVDPIKNLKHFEKVLKFDQYYERIDNRGWPGKGKYSDDTQLSLAVSEVLLNHSYPFFKHDFAESFVNAFHRDYRQGYARGFQAFMEATKTGQNLLNNISPFSNKNGAAMRSVPIGLLPTEQEVLNTAKLQAEITHNTDEGIFSAQATALLAHYAYYKKGKINKKSFKKYANQFKMDMRGYDETWLQPISGNNLGVKTFHAVYELLTNDIANRSMMDMLKWAIRLTGDIDSVASVTWGIGTFVDNIKDMPEWMEKDLEQGSSYGVNYLKLVGQKLVEKYPR